MKKFNSYLILHIEFMQTVYAFIHLPVQINYSTSIYVHQLQLINALQYLTKLFLYCSK